MKVATGARRAAGGGEEIACASVLASVAPGQLQGRLLRDVNLPEDQAAAKASATGAAISSCITRWTAARMAGAGAG
jgi:hypothetical protein